MARVWRVYDFVSPISRERIEEFYALPFDLRLAIRWHKIDDFMARQSLEHQSAMLRGQENDSLPVGFQSYSARPVAPLKSRCGRWPRRARRPTGARS